MAYDKVVDSAVLNTGLQTIANAIRAKAGTSEALAFPAGMVAAIEAISAGGGGEILGTTKYTTGEFTPASTIAASEITITTGLSDVITSLGLSDKKVGGFFLLWDGTKYDFSATTPNVDSKVGGSMLFGVVIGATTSSTSGTASGVVNGYLWNSAFSTSTTATYTLVAGTYAIDTVCFSYSRVKYAAGHRYCWISGFSEVD